MDIIGDLNGAAAAAMVVAAAAAAVVEEAAVEVAVPAAEAAVVVAVTLPAAVPAETVIETDTPMFWPGLAWFSELIVKICSALRTRWMVYYKQRKALNKIGMQSIKGIEPGDSRGRSLGISAAGLTVWQLWSE